MHNNIKPKPTLWRNIPSIWFDFQSIYDEAVERAAPGSSLVEVGSFWGQSALYLAEAAKIADKGLKVYCVDVWSRDFTNPDGDEGRIEARHHGSLFETFAYYIEQSGLTAADLRVLRMDSLEAAELFLCTNVSFVFLDNNHEYDHVCRELDFWWDIVKYTGFIAGHDWTDEFHGVKEAVTEFCDQNATNTTLELKGKSWILRPCWMLV